MGNRMRINRETHVVNEAQPQDTGIYITTTRIAPQEPGNDSGDKETAHED